MAAPNKYVIGDRASIIRELFPEETKGLSDAAAIRFGVESIDSGKIEGSSAQLAKDRSFLLDKSEKDPSTNPLWTFGKAAFNSAAFGAPAYFKEDYYGDDELRENQISKTLGDVAGMFVPGGILKAGIGAGLRGLGRGASLAAEAKKLRTLQNSGSTLSALEKAITGTNRLTNAFGGPVSLGAQASGIPNAVSMEKVRQRAQDVALDPKEGPPVDKSGRRTGELMAGLGGAAWALPGASFGRVASVAAPLAGGLLGASGRATADNQSFSEATGPLDLAFPLLFSSLGARASRGKPAFKFPTRTPAKPGPSTTDARISALRAPQGGGPATPAVEAANSDVSPVAGDVLSDFKIDPVAEASSQSPHAARYNELLKKIGSVQRTNRDMIAQDGPSNPMGWTIIVAVDGQRIQRPLISFKNGKFVSGSRELTGDRSQDKLFYTTISDTAGLVFRNPFKKDGSAVILTGEDLIEFGQANISPNGAVPISSDIVVLGHVGDIRNGKVLALKRNDTKPEWIPISAFPAQTNEHQKIVRIIEGANQNKTTAAPGMMTDETADNISRPVSAYEDELVGQQQKAIAIHGTGISRTGTTAAPRSDGRTPRTPPASTGTPTVAPAPAPPVPNSGATSQPAGGVRPFVDGRHGGDNWLLKMNGEDYPMYGPGLYVDKAGVVQGLPGANIDPALVTRMNVRYQALKAQGKIPPIEVNAKVLNWNPQVPKNPAPASNPNPNRMPDLSNPPEYDNPGTAPWDDSIPVITQPGTPRPSAVPKSPATTATPKIVATSEEKPPEGAQESRAGKPASSEPVAEEAVQESVPYDWKQGIEILRLNKMLPKKSDTSQTFAKRIAPFVETLSGEDQTRVYSAFEHYFPSLTF